MAELLRGFATDLHLLVLLLIIALAIYVLSAGADVLVTQAVRLSRRFRVSPVIIGATVVSLGTTMPETAVSVVSAIEGDPGLALGNAVGSIICNAALIIGVAGLIRPIPVDARTIRRQGTVQYAAAILLVLVSLPFATGLWGGLMDGGGRVPRWAGFLFVALLAAYLVASVRWSKEDGEDGASADVADEAVPTTAVETLVTVAKLVLGLALVVLASQVLIPAVEVSALRIGVPRAVVAASLVALGTSLPELMTAITASRRGYGGLAFGNVVGANVLNALLVVGLSTSVTPGGLHVSPEFYRLFYPAMLVSGLLLYGAAIAGRGRIGRMPALALLVLYLGFVVLGYAG
jgi:cation:H+ antiporter